MNPFGVGPLLVGCNFALVAAAAWLAWCGAGRVVARSRIGERPLSEQCLFAAVLTLSWLLASVLTLGAIHWLVGWTAWAALLPLAAIDGAARIRQDTRPDPIRAARRRLRILLAPRNAKTRGRPTLGAWLCVTLPLVALVAGLIWPRADYDALSYHLPFTAAALDRVADGAIPFVDTPFGDSAQAYQPKNDGLLRLALAPIPGSEALLPIGAWPHLPLLLLAVYVAARSLGARRSHALFGAATSTLLGPVVMAQAESAMVDLAFASPWFAAVAILCANVRANDRSGIAPALGAGLAAGLAFGAKFLAVPYAAILGLVLLRYGPRGVRAWLAFGLGCVVTGAFFYVRNAVWTGNPLYPIELAIPGGGPELLAGNYGRTEMLDWVYAFRTRPESLALRVGMFTHDLFGYAARFGPTDATLYPLVVPLILGGFGFARSVRARRGLPVVVIAPLAVVLCWWVVPYNYGRFAIPALAALGVGASLSPQGRLRRSILELLVFGHVLYLTWRGQGDTAVLMDHRTWSIALAGVGAAGWWTISRSRGRQRAKPSRSARLAWSMMPVAIPIGLGVGVAIASLRAPTIQVPWSEAADVAAKRSGAVAYAGTNLPWPLRHRSDGTPRRVRYIPLDGRSDRFDQRATRWHEDGLAAAICPEPAYYRRHREPKAWLQAMVDAGIETLVVARLTGIQRLNIEHDTDGFPIERSWADQLLALVHTSDAARVYAVPSLVSATADRLPADERRSPDALWLRARDPDAVQQRFPLAGEELAAPVYQRLIERARRR